MRILFLLIFASIAGASQSIEIRVGFPAGEALVPCQGSLRLPEGERELRFEPVEDDILGARLESEPARVGYLELRCEGMEKGVSGPLSLTDPYHARADYTLTRNEQGALELRPVPAGLGAGTWPQVESFYKLAAGLWGLLALGGALWITRKVGSEGGR